MVDCHVLLAEDEEQLRVGLECLLIDSGYKVTTAVDGRDALNKLRAFQRDHCLPDILVLDIHLPELSGIEVQDEMEFQNIVMPVLVITAYGNPEMLEALFHRGCAEFLAKPFKPEDFLRGLERAFEKFAQARRLREARQQYLVGEQTSLDREIAGFERKYREALHRDVADWAAFDRIDWANRSEDRAGVFVFRRRHQPERNNSRAFFLTRPTPGGRVGFIAMVSGNAPHAAAATFIAGKFFRDAASKNYPPARFMKVLGHLLITVAPGSRATALFLEIDLTLGLMKIAATGDLYVARVCLDDALPVHVFPSPNAVLGDPNAPDPEESLFTITAGDHLVAFAEETLGPLPQSAERRQTLANAWLTADAASLDTRVNVAWNALFPSDANEITANAMLLGLETRAF